MSENITETPKLKKAEDNPWYRLATIGGNPKQCAHYWNGWLQHCLVNNELNETDELWPKDNEGPIPLVELKEIELQLLEHRFPDYLPNPAREFIDFSQTEFSKHIDFERFIFFKKADFTGATFRDANFTGATFTNMADFSGAATEDSQICLGIMVFQKAKFRGQVSFQNRRFKRSTDFSHSEFFESALHEDTDYL